jgi:Aspartyl protease
MALMRIRRGVLRYRFRRLLLIVSLAGAVVLVPSVAFAQTQSAALRSLVAAVTRVRSTNCATSSPSASGSTVPIGVVHDGTARILLVGVCIDDQGPFIFILDTGAPYSLVGRSLAARLHLAAVGAPVGAGVLGCGLAADQPVRVSNWSAGGLGLVQQSLVSGSLGSFAPGLSLTGILGSDVLQRFGAVRIDYRTQTLTVESAETLEPSADSYLNGPVSPPSAFDLTVTPRVDLGVAVVVDQGDVRAVASLRIDRRSYPFIIDTGAAYLSINSQLAGDAKLKATATESLSATNCNSTTSLYRGGGGWRLGSFAIRTQLILGAPLGSNVAAGLLGSPVLSRFGAVVVDYTGARLLLSN